MLCPFTPNLFQPVTFIANATLPFINQGSLKTQSTRAILSSTTGSFHPHGKWQPQRPLLGHPSRCPSPWTHSTRTFPHLTSPGCCKPLGVFHRDPSLSRENIPCVLRHGVKRGDRLSLPESTCQKESMVFKGPRCLLGSIVGLDNQRKSPDSVLPLYKLKVQLAVRVWSGLKPSESSPPKSN